MLRNLVVLNILDTLRGSLWLISNSSQHIFARSTPSVRAYTNVHTLCWMRGGFTEAIGVIYKEAISHSNTINIFLTSLLMLSQGRLIATHERPQLQLILIITALFSSILNRTGGAHIYRQTYRQKLILSVRKFVRLLSTSAF